MLWPACANRGITRRRQTQRTGALLQHALMVQQADGFNLFRPVQGTKHALADEFPRGIDSSIQMHCCDQGFERIRQKRFALTAAVAFFAFPKLQVVAQI